MHRLLAHQLARVTDEGGEIDVAALLEAVSRAYDEADGDRRRTDRAALVMSQEMEELNAELHGLAHHDILTGLPNRRLFRSAMAQQLARGEREEIAIAVHSVSTLTGSRTLTTRRTSGSDAEELFRNADLALYQAKDSGRGRYRFFEPSIDRQMQARRIMEQDLRKALRAGQF